MTRAEHLAWCKQRAIAYIEAGDYKQALTSMLSDMRKHPETEKHVGLQMGVMLMISGHLSSPEEIRKFIEGFN